MQSAYFSLLLLLSGCMTHQLHAGHYNNSFNLLASLQEMVIAHDDDAYSDEESSYSSDDDDDMALDASLSTPSRFAEKVAKHLQKGGSPNACNDQGRSLCHLAAELDDVHALKMLISNNANINAMSPEGVTPVHLATYHNHTASLATLINHHAQLDTMTIDGFTPAHIAAQRNSVDACKLLAAHNAPLDMCDARKSTPLHWAASGGRFAIVDLLLSNGAGHCVNQLDIKEKTPLHRAAGVSSKVVKLLFESGHVRKHTIDKVDKEGSTPLLYAASGGRRKAMELLIAHNASINQRNKVNGRTALLWVQRMTDGSYEKGGRMMSKQKGLHMIKTLLDNGADPTLNDYQGYNPLYWALHTQRADEIALLQSYIRK